VPLPKIVANVLRAHLDQFRTVTWQSSEGPVQLLFPSHRRSGLLYQYYFRNEVWRPAATASRVSCDRTHALRHFFASSLLADRVPITDVAAWLGHASPEITYEYYGHLMPDAPDRGRAATDNAMAALIGATPTSGRSRQRRGARRLPGTSADSSPNRSVAA
jgi:integrase